LAGSIVPKIRKSAAVSIYPHAQTLIRTVHSPLMRFTSGDVGGTRTSLMALKRDAAAENPKINIREIFRAVRFSTFLPSL
jgi:hypothetical protein